MNAPARDNLVIVRAGPRSLHEAIRPRADSTYDLLVAKYHEVPYEDNEDNITYIYHKGSKIKGYYDLFEQNKWIFQYKYICLMDDDLLASCIEIDNLFSIGHQNGLKLFQPSLTVDSYFSYAGLINHRKTGIRFTNYVEMMCPVFSSDLLQAVAPTFNLGYETGIDILWPNYLPCETRSIGVVDGVSVRHTRRVGATKSANGFGEKERYDDQISRMLEQFGMTFPGVVCEGYSVDGRTVRRGKLSIAFATLRLLVHVFRTPMRRGMFVRFVTDHARHSLTRRKVWRDAQGSALISRDT